MKHVCAFLVFLVMLLRFTMIMAQSDDCEKKCGETFARCSAPCKDSASAACRPLCEKDRDECVKKCAAVKPKPAPKVDDDTGEDGEDDEAEFDEDEEIEDPEDVEEDDADIEDDASEEDL